jgi:hypothetical protein
MNRWGNIVYEANGYNNEFNGKDVEEGVYWYFYYPNPDLEPENLKQGFFHLFH